VHQVFPTRWEKVFWIQPTLLPPNGLLNNSYNYITEMYPIEV